MKKFCTSFLLILSFSLSFSQTAINFTDSSFVKDAVIVGDYIYLATQGGLVKYNKITNDKIFYNRGNSNIPYNDCLSLAVDTLGNLWITNYYGICYFDNGNFTSYTTMSSGLASNTNYTCFVDDANNLWLGSYGLVQKFDGIIWTTYPAAVTGQAFWYTFDITQDPLGNLWFATDAGVLQFDGTTWTSITNLGGNYVYTIVFDKTGVLYAGTANGLYKYNGAFSWTIYNDINTSMLLSNGILELAVDDENMLHIGTDNGLNKKLGDVWNKYSTFSGGTLPTNHCEAIVCDSDGFTYAFVPDYVIKTKGIGYINYNTSNSAILYNDVTCLTGDINNVIYYGTYYYGAGFKDGDVWTGFTTGNSDLPNNNIIDVCLDGNGDVWYSTDGGGVAKYDGVSWTIYDTGNGLADNQTGVLHFNDVTGKMYVATPLGLCEFDGTSWQTYNAGNSGLNFDNVTAMTHDATGKMWISTNGQLNVFDGTSWIAYNNGNSPWPLSTAFELRFDSQGNLWASLSNYGLYKYDGISWTIFNTGNSSIPNNFPMNFDIDTNDVLWIKFGLVGVGVRKFDGTTFTNVNSGIASLTVNDVYVDKSTNYPWYGTLSGISFYYKTDIFSNHNLTNSGLYSNAVYDIDVNPVSGKMWFGTANGISGFDGTNWENYSYDSTNIIAAHITSVCSDLNGQVYGGSNSGVTVFDGVTFTNYTTASTGYYFEIIGDIEVDSINNKWISTSGGGLYKFDNGILANYNTGNSGIQSNFISALEIDPFNATILVAGGAVGSPDMISVFDGTTWTYHDTLYESFPFLYIREMEVDQNGILWVATDHGLAKYDGITWTGYNMANTPQLQTDDIVNIQMDAAGLLWIATLNGLYTFDGTTWTHYTMDNSPLLQSHMLDVNVDQYGNPWISGAFADYGFAGLEIFNPTGILLPPTCDFSADNLTIIVNQTVNFTDLTTNNPTSWIWSFYSASIPTSSAQNPTGISYSLPGIYDVKLVASNVVATDSITKTLYITVIDSIPQAAFVASSSSININEMINFTDLSTHNPVTWNWNFPGANSSTSTSQNPINISYPVVGCYDVSLSVTNSGGNDAVTYTCYINVIDNVNNLNEQAGNDIRIYPNPTSTNIMLDFEKLILNPIIDIYDLAGKKCESISISQLTNYSYSVALNQLVPGMYFIKISDNHNQWIFKFVKN